MSVENSKKNLSKGFGATKIDDRIEVAIKKRREATNQENTGLMLDAPKISRRGFIKVSTLVALGVALEVSGFPFLPEIFSPKYVLVSMDSSKSKYGPFTPGTTTDGIQEAIGVASSEGRYVMIDSGIYRPTTSIVPYSNVNLIGAGMDNTIIRASGSGFSDSLFSSTQMNPGLENFLMQDLTVDGNELAYNCWGSNSVLDLTFNRVKFMNQREVYTSKTGFLVFFGVLGTPNPNANVYVSYCQFKRTLNGNDMLGGSIGNNGWIMDSDFDDGGALGEGIGLGGPNQNNSQNNIYALRNRFYNSADGRGFVSNAIHFEGNGRNLHIEHNNINSGGRALHIAPQPGLSWDDVTIMKNSIDGTFGFNSGSQNSGTIVVNQATNLKINENAQKLTTPGGIDLVDVAIASIYKNTVDRANWGGQLITLHDGTKHNYGAITMDTRTNPVTAQTKIMIDQNTLSVYSGTGEQIVIDSGYTNVEINGRQLYALLRP